ncbi:uncharacterized protein LOC115717778 [Cannabis sativa]|uniref:uncharacterized protein LOC115717778 n=1 Tax=Cannabis sativa TaxID=3483 RepID=UPI0029CA9C71|nr:uncharacterized protein LOC115717778 [Cannabis sativa]
MERKTGRLFLNARDVKEATWVKARAYFQCGLVGHMKRNFPQLLLPEQKKDDKPTPARVFALTQAEADAGPSTMTGQLSFDDTLLTVLIDSGATHSYISSRITEKLNRPSDVLSRGFKTLLPTGELVISNRWVRSLLVFVEGRELLPEDEDPFAFVGKMQGSQIPLILVLKAKDLLCEGCIGFLANVVVTTREPPSRPEHVPIVREFLDVFPEELLGLPPKREIDFEIDLIPGAEPVSRAP